MLAFTFPGQGSQRPGMGLPWREHESWELVDEASDVAGRDVAKLLCDADAEELRDTRNAQLTTFVSSLMVLDAVERLGVEPSFCAGHSLGEYTALTATGALGFDDGVRLVAARAAAMHDAGIAQPGTMAAVLGLDDDQVEIACRRADADVWVANFNAPGQVVIAGSPAGVEAAAAHAKELGAKKVMPLQVSGAFHTPLHGTGARPAARSTRRRPPTRHRCPGGVERRCDGARPRRRLGEPAVGATLEPRPLEALPAGARRRRRHEFRRARPGRRAHRDGQAHGHRRRTISVHDTRRPRQAPRMGRAQPGVVTSIAADAVEGEHLFAVERLVVSPGTGIFTPLGSIEDGARISVGTVIGHVGDLEVRSPFAGILQSYIAVDTERVTTRQPIAWLRST